MRYLERGLLEDVVIDRQVRSSTQDCERLASPAEEVRDRQGKVAKAADQCLLQTLKGLDAAYEGYEKALQSLRYLSDISEDTLYLLYEPALSIPQSTRPFEGFTQLHRDLFLRLKLRAIDAKISQGKTLERP